MGIEKFEKQSRLDDSEFMNQFIAAYADDLERVAVDLEGDVLSEVDVEQAVNFRERGSIKDRHPWFESRLVALGQRFGLSSEEIQTLINKLFV